MNNSLQKILDNKVIAIIRGISSKYILDTVQALSEGGVRCVEVTFNPKDEDASKDTLNSIEMIKTKFGEDVAVGAGTVLTIQNVLDASNAGAEYMISPNVNLEIIRKTKEIGCVSIPGALTPSEAVSAYDEGADIIKLFPAGVLGTEYVKALVSPLNHILFAAVGGITPQNAPEFITAGAIGVGVGGSLVSKTLIEAGEFDKIKQFASEFKL